jgi:hypothetical protein
MATIALPHLQLPRGQTHPHQRDVMMRTVAPHSSASQMHVVTVTCASTNTHCAPHHELH